MEIREIRNALKRIYKERKSWNGAKGPFTESAIRQRELILIKQKILYRIEDAKLLKDKGEEYFYLALYKIMNNYINANKLEGEIFEKIREFEEDLLIVEARIQNLKKFDYLYESFNSARRKLLIESLVKKVTVDSKKKIDLKLSLPLYPLSSLPNRACPERSRRVQGGISCLG